MPSVSCSFDNVTAGMHLEDVVEDATIMLHIDVQ